MIITNGEVSMSSKHEFSSYSCTKSLSVVTNGDESVNFDTSEGAKTLFDQLSDYSTEKQEEERQQLAEQMEDYRKELQEVKKKAKADKIPKNPVELKFEVVRRVVEMLKRIREGKNNISDIMEEKVDEQVGFEKESLIYSSGYSGLNLKTGRFVQLEEGENVGSLNAFKRTTVVSSFYSEQENMAYQATGVAKTADGREIEFGVTLEMSRSFSERFEYFTKENIYLKDPLVINYRGNSAEISDMKFLFDLDCDGVEDEMSMPVGGSGFLALDKNGDGSINDGSELFGPSTDNGFEELAAYDEDGNGWIDEADSIFERLRIWSKDENGNDVLISLKDADVGAIYLGRADTGFTLRGGEDYSTKAVIGQTGIFLKESGGVGTVQHVDFAI